MIHSVCDIRVRYAETDRMDVVYHANYLVWFESARIQMLDEIGAPYREMEAQGLLIPVLSANVEYRRPAKFDDRIQVHLFMREKPRARFKFEYEVRRDDTLLATGSSTHGFMSPEGKGLRPPEEFLQRLNQVWEE